VWNNFLIRLIVIYLILILSSPSFSTSNGNDNGKYTFENIPGILFINLCKISRQLIIN
jgi:hypothetical protein